MRVGKHHHFLLLLTLHQRGKKRTHANSNNRRWTFHTHTIHVWYIYQHVCYFWVFNIWYCLCIGIIYHTSHGLPADWDIWIPSIHSFETKTSKTPQVTQYGNLEEQLLHGSDHFLKRSTRGAAGLGCWVGSFPNKKWGWAFLKVKKFLVGNHIYYFESEKFFGWHDITIVGGWFTNPSETNWNICASQIRSCNPM